MKNVLVIQYSQTGQATDIVRSVLSPLEQDENIQITYETIKPIDDYPFPWTSSVFFETFPETHQEVPCPLKTFDFDPSIDYDLIVIGYQVWYLTPSIPINSFMSSEEAKKIMKNKPVITIIGCRNMWAMAQEKMKRKIKDLEGHLIGNIALVDKAPNLVSVATILRWMLTGKKDKFGLVFPKSGVSEKDIIEASRFGTIIRNALSKNIQELAQQELNKLGAVNIFPNLVMLEKRANGLFGFWSKFIRDKGGPFDPNRKFRMRIFTTYLFIGIIVLSPITTIISWMLGFVLKSKIQKQVEYYSQNSLQDEFS